MNKKIWILVIVVMTMFFGVGRVSLAEGTNPATDPDSGGGSSGTNPATDPDSGGGSSGTNPATDPDSGGGASGTNPATDPDSGGGSSGTNPAPNEQSISFNNPIPSTSVPQFIAVIIKGILGILATITICIVLYGGFVYMLAGENASKTQESLNIIKNAVIGLAIIMAAYLIVDFVVSALT